MRILLIAHKFSPNNNVGARRWTKFYKYIRKSGVEITVLTGIADPQSNNWGFDTSGDPNIIRSNGFIDRLSKITFFSKIIYFFRILINHKFLKHTDEGFGFSQKIYKKAKKIITEKKITHLIATNPPNSIAYFAAKIKREFPELILVQDFRDAWMQAYETYKTGYDETHDMYKREQYMEVFAAENADIILSVVPETTEYFKKYNPRTFLLTNGYDPQDQQLEQPAYPEHILKKDKINLCHFGTLDFGRETEFLRFIRELFKNTSFQQKLHIVLAGFVHEHIKTELSNYSNIILVEKLTGMELERVMFHSDIHLVVNDKILYYAYGSKIFDAFLYQKPLLFITRKQSLSDFVEIHRLGIWIDPDLFAYEHIEQQISELIKRSHEENFKEYYRQCTQSFNVVHLTNQLLHVIDQKNNA